MPDYKKRRVNKLRGAKRSFKKKRHENFEDNDIVMSSAKKKSTSKNSDMHVVKGKKLEQRRRLKIVSGGVGIIAVVCIILNLILPMGIIENLQNTFATIGSGGYPIELDSSDTLNAVSRGQYYYVLTDTRLNAFSNGGKEIFSYPHGYEKPIIKTSKTRVLIFNQGGKEAKIFNLAGLKQTIKTEQNIICAALSDGGVYAVATQSDTYASAVTVYSKYGKVIYEWFSSKDIINNIAISPNGKKIAVSVFNVTSGKYTSKVMVFNFKSATPEYTEKIEDGLVFSLDTTHTSRFAILTKQGVRFVKWSKFKASEYNNDYSLTMFRGGSGGYVAVFNRDSDRSDNRLAVFSTSGELKYEFTIKGIISDIQIKGSHIYCISDTDILLYGKEGKVLRQAKCGFGGKKLSVVGTNYTAVLTDNDIEKIKLEQVK